MAIRRVYVEKKPGFDVEAVGIFFDLKNNLQISSLIDVRLINRYDIDGITESEYKAARGLIFSEPPVDFVYDEEIEILDGEKVFAIEYLPGQYDQRADSAAQCIQILTAGDKPIVKVARIYILKGVNDEELERIKSYMINPVEAHEAQLSKPSSLVASSAIPEDVKTVEGFIEAKDEDLQELTKEMGFAMDVDDLKFCRDYFKKEGRNPSVTEIRVIDTYWSDHCRHTTFSTIIEDVQIKEGKYKALFEGAYNKYKEIHHKLRAGKDECLMDIATIATKALKETGILKDLDESEEINACSVVIDVDVNGKNEEWLLMFKNETHNHPTEIEPFGGAATCLGGAIRDPLSGRSYVYQAMRVTGSGDPRTSVMDTLPGKLPQRKISRTAAAGYSSYGNQIGLATGQVTEIYDEGYIAKRMEIGAVIGAAPKENVVRECPVDGDIIILLGGGTGRDGCGGATGSSKAHTEESLENCGAEVQKGNPPVERKIQRLFRKKELTTLIKRCNDFGAGGVCVAIGELADGLKINLDAVPKKYEGLDGTELAISESQERMAVVVAKEDVEKFIEQAALENLEATIVAVVTATNRLEMQWRGENIVDISREFLNTNGAKKYTKIVVEEPTTTVFKKKNENWFKNLGNINVCSQKGLVERFDSTIGANSVLLPFGGKYQNTPAEGMAAKIPVLNGETNTASLMSYGYNPEISKWSPYHGAVFAVLESASKIASMGGDYKKIRLSFQEYFERLGNDPSSWGKPFSALLGALTAQLELGLPAIGGKDSMSGSFLDLDVPPTLVSFAVTTADARKVISPEFKKAGNKIVLFAVPRDENDIPQFSVAKENYDNIKRLIDDGKIVSASVVKAGGIAEAVAKMAFGNKLAARLDFDDIYSISPGSIVAEMTETQGLVIGEVWNEDYFLVNGERISLDESIKAWEQPLEKVFPTKVNAKTTEFEPYLYKTDKKMASFQKFASPKVFIPVFPGTNCEYDTARAFNNAGATADVFVIKNLSSSDIDYSLKEMARRIAESQIIMLPGGFSGGDEPDGSGKFIATAFRNKFVREATMNLLKNRDGLMLGICNGFQALIKLGLVPYGEICDMDEESPTLTFNTLGRHISKMVYTKVVSNVSPWFNNVALGDTHAIAVSHGEGRFFGNESVINELRAKGQIATQYVDQNGNPTMDIDYNPNGSIFAIEGISSEDGRVLGKMGHSERKGSNVAKNIIGEKEQKLFEAGVSYFK